MDRSFFFLLPSLPKMERVNPSNDHLYNLTSFVSLFVESFAEAAAAADITTSTTVAADDPWSEEGPGTVGNADAAAVHHQATTTGAIISDGGSAAVFSNSSSNNENESWADFGSFLSNVTVSQVVDCEDNSECARTDHHFDNSGMNEFFLLLTVFFHKLVCFAILLMVQTFPVAMIATTSSSSPVDTLLLQRVMGHQTEAEKEQS
jgi:hypothetical protein